MKEDVLRYCRDALPGVSRTFALGIGLLRHPLRDETGVAYLICRILDTIEDTTSLPGERRAALLERSARNLFDGAAWRECASGIEDLLADPGLTGNDHDLCRHATVVMEAFHSLRPSAAEAMHGPIGEMALGMAATVRREMEGSGLHLETMEDLERYCYYVAGTVGNLLTNLFAMDRPSIDDACERRLRETAVRFGLGLQATNIIKNVTDDISRGIAYVPRSLFERTGVDLQTLIDRPDDPRGRQVVAMLVEATLAWLDDALDYTLAVPAAEEDIRLFCALPLLFAVRTLGLAVRTTEVFSEETLKISRQEVGAIHRELVPALADDRALAGLYRRERDRVLTP